MIRQRVDCPYFLRLAVMASRFSLRHKLNLRFFSLDFCLGSHLFVILSFRSFNSLFSYQFSRILIIGVNVWFCFIRGIIFMSLFVPISMSPKSIGGIFIMATLSEGDSSFLTLIGWIGVVFPTEMETSLWFVLKGTSKISVEHELTPRVSMWSRQALPRVACLM